LKYSDLYVKFLRWENGVLHTAVPTYKFYCFRRCWSSNKGSSWYT